MWIPNLAASNPQDCLCEYTCQRPIKSWNDNALFLQVNVMVVSNEGAVGLGVVFFCLIKVKNSKDPKCVLYQK